MLPDYNPRVPDQPFNLALETSGRVGSFCIGRGDELLESLTLAPQRRGAGSGGSSELMTALDVLCKKHGVAPSQIGQAYLSIGPGSFTGLRIGVAIVKMLALVQQTKIVAVPSLDVAALNAPADAEHVAVCLNLKKESVYCAVYQRDGNAMKEVVEPALRTIEELLAVAPRPLTLIGDPLPVVSERESASGVVILSKEQARGRAEAVWQLGRAAARDGRFDDPLALVPLYVRPPEAVTLWDRLHGPAPATK